MIYFDNNATTRVDPEVVDAMLPYFSEKYGNPSTAYKIGKEAREAIAYGVIANLSEGGACVWTDGFLRYVRAGGRLSS